MVVAAAAAAAVAAVGVVVEELAEAVVSAQLKRDKGKTALRCRTSGKLGILSFFASVSKR